MKSEYTVKQIAAAVGHTETAVSGILRIGKVKYSEHPEISKARFYNFEDLPEKYRMALKPQYVLDGLAYAGCGTTPAYSGGAITAGNVKIAPSEKEEIFVPKPPEPAKTPPEVIDERYDEIETVEGDETIYGEGFPPIGPVSNVTADFIRELKEIFEPAEVRNILMNNFQFNIG